MPVDKELTDDERKKIVEFNAALVKNEKMKKAIDKMFNNRAQAIWADAVAGTHYHVVKNITKFHFIYRLLNDENIHEYNKDEVELKSQLDEFIAAEGRQQTFDELINSHRFYKDYDKAYHTYPTEKLTKDEMAERLKKLAKQKEEA